ncbi:MAG TPA: S53 family peptidase [Patescibacteria group bacterium]|jgi:subtilase family serine protease|nr:S53 family peptidase [Patescibacteria group bacterium]
MKYLVFATKFSLMSLILASSLVSFQPVLAKQPTDVGQEKEKNKKVCDIDSDTLVSCHARVVVDAQGQPKAAQLPAGLSPAQMRSAYNVANISLAAATNRTVAIVDAYDDPNAFADLTTYSQTFGIAPTINQCAASTGTAAAPCFQKVNQTGTTKMPATNAGWALEISLDVQTVRAICPQCNILLVEANSASYTDLMTAVDRAVSMGAKVVSNSYGSSEFNTEASFDSHFNKPGVAFTVSSGDNGFGAQYPAASRYVTAVGGTTLNMSGLTRLSETAWSGAGSGCSLYEALVTGQTADATCAKRKISDVSAVADPATGAAVYDTVRYSGKSGWFKVGGTSLAAPLIASIYALAGPTGYASIPANSLPYANFNSLNDVLTGNNGTCAGTYLCTAKIGYDGPTGMGTPNGLGAF